MSQELQKIYHAFLQSGQKICTDTRKIEKGALFFALRGPNFNANELAQKAIELGCSIAVIDDEKFADVQNTILVNDVLKMLHDLANYHRRQLTIPILGITGSNGKTTSKELINAVLSKKFNTLATYGNLNNHIGVPLTLLSITKEHEFAIIEMGANHQGEINMLCEIAEPDYGVITNIGKAHLEGFGGIEGVKKGKSEMYKYIAKKRGKIFLHGDDEVLHDLAKENDKITYGTKKVYDVVGKLKQDDEKVQFAWKTRYNASELQAAPFVSTHIVGVYNYYNLLCAACVGNFFKVDENLINEALSEYEPSNNRSQLHKTQRNTLILDYYNANPTSMRAAIENFAQLQLTGKCLILGDMLELGEESIAEHKAIIDLLHEKKLNDYFLVGPIFKGITSTKSFNSSEEARGFLSTLNLKDKTILVKGSRGIKLEVILDSL
jgi:UDP-N-acetylmuramoyl-tripeptide--D-alanyl-D-alanine ligase